MLGIVRYQIASSSVSSRRRPGFTMESFLRLQSSSVAAKFLFTPLLGFVDQTSSLVSSHPPSAPKFSPKIFDVELRQQHFQLRSGNFGLQVCLPPRLTFPLWIFANGGEQLSLPDTSSLLLKATNPAASTLINEPDLFQQYVAFRQSAEPWVYPSEAAVTKKCANEIQSIAQLIPNTHDPVYIICLAANLFWLCAMDDLVESVPACDALEILRSAQAIFLQQTHTTTSARMPLVTANEIISPLERGNHMCRSYLQFLTSHLHPTQINPCRTTIVETLRELLQESQLRQDPNPSVEVYLEARKLSMAESPFWFLSQGPAGKRPMSQTSPTLRKLIDLAALATGMQNDILGLQKDLATGDEMNYVLVAARRSGESLKDISAPHQVWKHVERGIALHDATVQEAMQCWLAIRRDEKGIHRDEWDLADTLLIAVERHARWVATNKRYDFA